jgi:hypothetical protein
MTNPRRQLAIRGVIFIVLVGLLFFFSRYIPQPFTALMPPGEDFDDFEAIYSSSDKLSKFLQSLGPYSPAVFVLLQILQVAAAPFPGELTGVAGGYVYGETMGFLLSTVGLTIGSWVAFELASILGRLPKGLSLLSPGIKPNEAEYLPHRIHHRSCPGNLSPNRSGRQVSQSGILRSGHLRCRLRGDLACGIFLPKPDLPLD